MINGSEFGESGSDINRVTQRDSQYLKKTKDPTLKEEVKKEKVEVINDKETIFVYSDKVESKYQTHTDPEKKPHSRSFRTLSGLARSKTNNIYPLATSSTSKEIPIKEYPKFLDAELEPLYGVVRAGGNVKFPCEADIFNGLDSERKDILRDKMLALKAAGVTPVLSESHKDADERNKILADTLKKARDNFRQKESKGEVDKSSLNLSKTPVPVRRRWPATRHGEHEVRSQGASDFGDTAAKIFREHSDSLDQKEVTRQGEKWRSLQNLKELADKLKEDHDKEIVRKHLEKQRLGSGDVDKSSPDLLATQPTASCDDKGPLIPVMVDEVGRQPVTASKKRARTVQQCDHEKEKVCVPARREKELEVQSQGAALTSEAGNTSRRQVVVEATARSQKSASARRTPDESGPNTSRVMRTNFGDTKDKFREAMERASKALVELREKNKNASKATFDIEFSKDQEEFREKGKEILCKGWESSLREVQASSRGDINEAACKEELDKDLKEFDEALNESFKNHKEEFDKDLEENYGDLEEFCKVQDKEFLKNWRKEFDKDLEEYSGDREGFHKNQQEKLRKSLEKLCEDQRELCKDLDERLRKTLEAREIQMEFSQAWAEARKAQVAGVSKKLSTAEGQSLTEGGKLSVVMKRQLSLSSASASNPEKQFKSAEMAVLANAEEPQVEKLGKLVRHLSIRENTPETSKEFKPAETDASARVANPTPALHRPWISESAEAGIPERDTGRAPHGGARLPQQLLLRPWEENRLPEAQTGAVSKKLPIALSQKENESNNAARMSAVNSTMNNCTTTKPSSDFSSSYNQNLFKNKLTDNAAKASAVNSIMNSCMATRPLSDFRSPCSQNFFTDERTKETTEPSYAHKKFGHRLTRPQ